MVNKVAFETLIDVLKEAQEYDLKYDQNNICHCSIGHITDNLEDFPGLKIYDNDAYVDDELIIEYFNITDNQFKRLFWFEGDTYPYPPSRTISEQIKLIEKVMNES